MVKPAAAPAEGEDNSPKQPISTQTKSPFFTPVTLNWAAQSGNYQATLYQTNTLDTLWRSYANLAIGNILLFRDTGTPTSTAYDNIGVVVSKTAPNIASPGAYPVTVKILPKYDSTLKKFAFAFLIEVLMFHFNSTLVAQWLFQKLSKI